MATLTFYLDQRSAGLPTLKICVNHRSSSSYITTGIHLETKQWSEKKQRIVGLPQLNRLNALITTTKAALDMALIELQKKEGIRLHQYTATTLRNKLVLALHEADTLDDEQLLSYQFNKFISTKNGRTKECYEYTLRRLNTYANMANVRLSDITKDWLLSFDMWLSKTSPSKNARNIHFRNMRAVFNAAIDNNVTTHYPFRNFPIRPAATAKRNLTLAQLSALWGGAKTATEQQYIDVFRLMLYLRGINITDLFHLTPQSIINGRIEYRRAKTHKLYSIRIEPEIAVLLGRLHGAKWLIYAHDTYSSPHDYMRRLNENIKRIARRCLPPHIASSVTSYYARHSWATIASSLDVPKDVIAAGLGHGGNTVTDIYIDYDIRKVDAANRMVIDAVEGDNIASSQHTSTTAHTYSHITTH